MKKSTFRRNRVSRLAGGALITAALLVQGCLQRPVQEQSPNTSNIFVQQIVNSSINEIDLLFVIDNSVSMGDKQKILAVAVPKMVQRLITPNCVDSSKNYVGPSTLQGLDAQGNALPPTCAEGQLEFVPVNDIHLGIISSSLGGHGSTRCPRAYTDPAGAIWYQDDQGHMIPSVRPALADKGVDNLGYLAWNGGDAQAAQGLNDAFTMQVQAVGELGCGYEATLESWYRFLVDPFPPQEIVVTGEKSGATTDPSGLPLIDNDLLAQRDGFLRPEGLVAIVVLTDENDCSIMDGGDYYSNAKYGYLLASNKNSSGKDFFMPESTAECDTNPNDKCCLSCLYHNSPPAGCEATVAAACDAGDDLPPELDAGNVRCFDNRRRFGIDLLYPTQRYVDALTQGEITDGRTGQVVSNPLLQSSEGIRPLGRVFFAGIVGVPWQDISTPDSYDPNNADYSPDRLRYLTAKDLSDPNVTVNGVAVSRWEMILGEPNLAATSKTCEEKDNAACGLAPTPPVDPFMIEQIGPRMVGAMHPLVAAAISNPDSADPQENVINGHEYNTGVPDTTDPDELMRSPAINDDLQYACIFKLQEPMAAAECATSQSCDCWKEPTRNRPLCQPPGGGGTQAAQYWGKAYPGTRILQVLRDFGANSIVGSICPKVTDSPETKADYGYNPAVQAIVDRLAEKLVGACLPRELTIDEMGNVPCFVVEAKQPVDVTDPNDKPLDCGADGRREATQQVQDAVRKQLGDTKLCKDADHKNSSKIECSEYKMCEIKPLAGQGRGECLYNRAPAESLTEAGYCYIDPAKTSAEGGAYVAGGSKDEASQANHGDTVPEDGTNLIVADCPATQRRLLRFVGQKTPADGTITLVACAGDAAGNDGDIPVAPMPSTTGDDQL